MLFSFGKVPFTVAEIGVHPPKIFGLLLSLFLRAGSGKFAADD
jgi:hypothetical protein